mgnify:FL=1
MFSVARSVRDNTIEPSYTLTDDSSRRQMKTYMIRAERKVIGYYHIKTKSFEEAKRQASYQMDVNPQNCLEEEKYEEIVLPEKPMLIEPYNEFIKEKK